MIEERLIIVMETGCRGHLNIPTSLPRERAPGRIILVGKGNSRVFDNTRFSIIIVMIIVTTVIMIPPVINNNSNNNSNINDKLRERRAARRWYDVNKTVMCIMRMYCMCFCHVHIMCMYSMYFWMAYNVYVMLWHIMLWHIMCMYGRYFWSAVRRGIAAVYCIKRLRC